MVFLGRSNVGKSSLINRLLGAKGLARTSSQPGRTRSVNFYRVNEWCQFIDLPGYGWAKVSRKERESWQRLVERYLEDRPVLCAAVLLQDLRREPGEDEELLLEWLAECLEDGPAELRELVEEQDSAVRQRGLARSQRAPAPDQARVGDAVMGGSEGRTPQ